MENLFPFRAALNASTLFPYRLGIRDQLQVAAEAGYKGIEIWMKDLQAYAEAGGSVHDLKRTASELGIEIANAISFIPWADDDAGLRSRGKRQTEEELSLLAELGCPSFAAPPLGTVDNATLDELAVRYAELCELAKGYGVAPILEFWGRAKKLSRLSEAAYVAKQSGVTGATLLLDPFHMYTGGSSVSDIAHLNGYRIGIVHANDYPASPARETISDADRLFPGEGIAPSSELARLLHAAGYEGFLSLELFAADYGGSSALEVAKRGLSAIKQTYAI
ncbi:sugar phosphate isomerase/epimerase [Cohnella endophytica]|uniref:Sugar phosphate isomerase/epimerase n=1 Tax=Cohnella endophytica TaxID=2419778 RepID=A0A494X8G4_9BACL|nr:sugar phosphate isomerase/epimerase family protein [Cohnella endophytica]RKP46750.1 sugar phosphate isomerase/epimerase [Cohnella endophytica]